jgi:ABC-2 type transporter
MSAAWRTVAEMQARDLLRRHAAIGLLVALPMTWYLAEAAAGIDYAVGTGVLAMAWSAAAACLFAFVGARHVDQRLVLASYRPRDIVLGRLLALLGVSATIALVVGIVMVIGSRPDRTGDVFLALALTTLVSTSVGWLIAAVVPRELEGTLLLIGIVGLQVSIPVAGAADLFIPYYAPLRLTDYERTPVFPVGPTAHAVVWAVAIGLVALALWRRHVLVRSTASGRQFDRIRTARRRTPEPTAAHSGKSR